MANSIAYANYLGKQITKQQLQDLDDYQISFYEDDVLVKTEYYNNRVISSYSVFLNDKLEIPTVLNNYSTSLVDIIIRSSSGVYKIEESFYYDSMILKTRAKYLYDLVGNLLCEQGYDISNELPILESTEKYLYVENEELFVLGFTYKSDGAIDSVWGDWVYNTDQRHVGSIYNNEIGVYFPTLFSEHPYYSSAQFLPS